jgi:hemoglobin-like flavoprotein
MTADQKKSVRDSFEMVLPIRDDAAALFYGRLFELDPTLRPMFKGDLTEQGRKLMQALALAVASLDKLDELAPALQDMGRKHVTYGVEAAHYNTVGAAMIWTLEQGLGPAFTPDVRDAWVSVYGVVASTMQAHG